MSSTRTARALVGLIAALVVAPVVVARAWRRSRTQVHVVAHRRG
jgi:hypothetical protein